MMNKMCHGWCGWTPFIARLLLASVFIYAGVGKFMGIDGTAGYIAGVMGVSAGMSVMFAWAAAIIETLGGILIVVGRWKKLASWVLIVFTIIATYFFHFKGALAGDPMQWVQTLKNLGLIGGLMLLGGSPWSHWKDDEGGSCGACCGNTCSSCGACCKDGDSKCETCRVK